MLQKITREGTFNPLIFKDIRPNEVGQGVCYVSGGIVKVSKLNKPFITLYLQDSNGIVIPGYVFDVDNFKASGLELSQAIHSLVVVKYTENFLPKFGLTLNLESVELLLSPPMDLLKVFVGSTDKVDEKYHELMNKLSNELDIKVTLPYTICNLYHIDYNQGRTGGLIDHYLDMFSILKTYSMKFSNKERKQLFATFLLYIYVHNNYIAADSKEEADITLVTQLMSAISNYMSRLNMGAGASEVVHIFFGYEPKDIYVRLVSQVSKDLIRATAEINTWKTLPISREGNAGYGTIKRYVEEVGK